MVRAPDRRIALYSTRQRNVQLAHLFFKMHYCLLKTEHMNLEECDAMSVPSLRETL